MPQRVLFKDKRISKKHGSASPAVRYQLPENEFKNGEMKQASAFSDKFHTLLLPAS